MTVCGHAWKTGTQEHICTLLPHDGDVGHICGECGVTHGDKPVPREVAVEAPTTDAKRQELPTRPERPMRRITVSHETTVVGQRFAVTEMMHTDRHGRASIVPASDLDFFIAQYLLVRERWLTWKASAHRLYVRFLDAKRMVDTQEEQLAFGEAKTSMLAAFRSRVRAMFSDEEGELTDQQVLERMHILLRSHAARGRLLDTAEERIRVLRQVCRRAATRSNRPEALRLHRARTSASRSV